MFSGRAQNTNGQQIVGAIYSYDSNGGGAGFRIVYNTDPANPGGAPANQVVSQGTLPMPNSGENVPLPPNALPANLSKPTYNNSGNQDGTKTITDNNGLIPKY